MISAIRVKKIYFPSLTGEQAKRAEALTRALLPSRAVPMDLDRILAAFERGKAEVRTAEVNFDPPKIIVSNEHGILVNVAGDPQLVEVTGRLEIAFKVPKSAFDH